MGSPVCVCPICNELGTIEKKWVRKKSGKRYDYEVFHHENVAHWVRVGALPSARAGKDDIRLKLAELLNSYRFRRAIFTSNDIASEIEKGGAAAGYKVVRRGLLKLVESGLLTIVRKDRKVYFINSPSQERPDYIMKRVNITLEDITNEGTFERHYLKTTILNDNKFPLQYIQFRATGDNVRDRSKLSFSAYDISRKEKAIIYFIEDDCQRKRILIEPSEPIQSGTKRALSIEYFWPEIGPSYTFTAPTPLDFVRFSIVSGNDFTLTVTRTNSGRTVKEDESSRVISSIRKGKVKGKMFEMKDLPAFAVLKFEWKRS